MITFLKKNLVTILIVLATLVLAGIAIYTAIRLYQLRQTTVAPNAPSSQPAAFQAGVDCTTLTTQDACQAAECTWKINEKNANRSKCTKGDACLISFSINQVSTPTPTPTGSATASPSGSPTASPSGSPTASPSGSASATPTPTATPVPPLSCGDSCSDNTDCTNSMVCSNGICRNPSCLNAVNCVCSTATTPPGTGTPLAQAPSEPELPAAGTGLPTILGAAAGILLLLGAFVLAL